MALVALAMVAIISMAALSIDVGTLYQASAEAQRAADAAAMAGARTISMSGLTSDPTNGASGGTVSWAEICGGPTSPASVAGITTGQQNSVARLAPTVTILYSAGSAAAGSGGTDCSSISGFGVNPVVTAKVQQANLPIFFARIFSLIPGVNYSGSGVTATASAEAFNSSNAGSYAVTPRCVKPWVVPNYDPAGGLCANNCLGFVDTSDGAIVRPGILADGSGVVGEQFWLIPDCKQPGSPNTCTLLNTQPLANQLPVNESPTPTVGTLEYLPASIVKSPSASTAVPACSGDGVSGNYAQAIAGCDQATQYQCGSSQANNVDLTENPVHPSKSGDTTDGGECLVHEDSGTLSGQDQLLTAASGNYPFQIQAGANNPLVLAPGGLSANTLITSSTSIVSLPIYDQTSSVISQSGPNPVTIVGFLQVFINSVDQYGNVNVTVMNVTGCAPNGGSNPTFNGTSSVPVRLITAP
jgi:Flp pilus assembly protein TadG